MLRVLNLTNYTCSVPNAIGLSLGILQGILCVMYPAKGQDFVADLEPLSLVDEDSEPEPGSGLSLIHI